MRSGEVKRRQCMRHRVARSRVWLAASGSRSTSTILGTARHMCDRHDAQRRGAACSESTGAEKVRSGGGCRSDRNYWRQQSVPWGLSAARVVSSVPPLVVRRAHTQGVRWYGSSLQPPRLLYVAA